MIAQFSLRLICGMSLMWCIMPRDRVTSGFFRIQMLVVLGLSVLAVLTHGHLITQMAGGRVMLVPSITLSLCVGLAIVSFLGSVMWTLERRHAGSFFGFLIAGASAAFLLGTSWLNGTGLPFKMLCLSSELSTAALLGGAVTGMLLGHWYLTAPTMSLAPLNRLNLYFGIAGVVRLTLSGIGLWLAWEKMTGNTYWLWLTMRWAAGILGPLLVCVMVWRILKYKNTQAATGALFVGVILTFIGELTATLLFRELSMPL